jgi:hypothetical protein
LGSNLERSVNLVAYERMKSELDEKYPKGLFVGIAQGKIVADATKLDDLMAKVRNLGLDPRRVLAIQAGDDTPHYAIILWFRYPPNPISNTP